MAGGWQLGPVLLPREPARDLGGKYLGTLVGRCFASGPPWQEEFLPAQHLGRKMNFSLVTLQEDLLGSYNQIEFLCSSKSVVLWQCQMIPNH